MPNQFDTSFIPQQPLLKVEGVARRHFPVNLAFILGLIMFIVSAAVAGGTYFYKTRIDAEVLAKQEKLEAAEKDLAVNDIELYKRIDTRLLVAKNLLDSHTVFSVVLDFLEEGSAQNVGLTSLGYLKENNDYLLSLMGQATSYGAVYFQSEAWRGLAPLVKKVEILSVSLDEMSGVVNFSAKIVINSEYTKYSRLLEAERQIEEAQLNAPAPPTVPANSPNPPQP